MRKGGRDSTKEQIVFIRGYDGHGEESGKIPTGRKKKICTDWPIQSDSKKKKLTTGKEERIITRSTLIATWDQNQRYILPSIPPPLSQWIKNTRDGPG